MKVNSYLVTFKISNSRRDQREEEVGGKKKEEEEEERGKVKKGNL